MFNSILKVSLLALLSSCNMDLTDGDAFTGGGSQSKLFGPSGAVSGDGTGKKLAIQGKYLIRVALHPIAEDETNEVVTLQGLEASAKGCICVGAVFLNIKDDFSLEFPNSKAKCALIGELNLEELLGGMGDDPDREKAAETDGKMLRLKKMGPMSFTPARPLLVGPIVQDMTSFQGYTETKDYQVDYNDTVTGKSGQSSGQISVNVLEAGSQFKPPFMAKTQYQNIVKFEMRSTGFKNVPRAKGLLMDRVEFTLNTRPIAIPRIMLESKASDLMSAAPPPKPGQGGAASLGSSPLVKFFGQFILVYIRLDATSFKTN